MTESFLEAFQIWTDKELYNAVEMTASRHMRAAFESIYDNLACTSEGDPPQLFVDNHIKTSDK
ncbi:hypothetical protein PtA15_8A209 [Puccinia triticina]|uniref:Uncharacterized protein n=1 Tax=Puccinia triticina TaxID=208348 RepID=A0ABY7CU50_9BASI|nr:uncharacterized protein PtA15_8A209 [Puccinia triticina]WAQ87305.1 hypothetical protein PtA15_8A209 [Puccinia triticina]